MKKNLQYVMLCTLAILIFSSCEHKELCYDHPHMATVWVEFDWMDDPDANPEGMCVYFYPMDGKGSMRRFDFKGMMGGHIELAMGKYRVLCYNNDTEAVLFGGTNRFETHMGLHVRATSLRPFTETRHQKLHRLRMLRTKGL